jgi:hypothetical protein
MRPRRSAQSQALQSDDALEMGKEHLYFLGKHLISTVLGFPALMRQQNLC